MKEDQLFRNLTIPSVFGNHKADVSELSNVFETRRQTEIKETALYICYYKTIPNTIEELGIDCRKANKRFQEKYSEKIKDFCYQKRYLETSGKEPELDDIFYFLYEDLLVNFDTNFDAVRFLFRVTDYTLVNEIIQEVRKFAKKSRRKPTISILVETNRGISTQIAEIKKPQLRIEDNYNDDFLNVHSIIAKRLSKKNDKGLVLLHGKPGTGKTTYIRYLCASLRKNIIFLPPNMANSITNPHLIEILIDNPNSIFVIEDAENIILDRGINKYSPISTLLNLSDGLLSDCLNIQIICSFNTELSKVDTALLRKGRLIAKYDFKELAVDKAQKLSTKLGFNNYIDEPMTLTAIYNQTETDFTSDSKIKKIGF